ncbi:MAG: porphyrin biosynthesis protein [Pelagibacteraceae bacterium TMED287]|nr:MAG: porphyrin biosynthesis protein [Pelagibacteraceae bacterium TMED287]
MYSIEGVESVPQEVSISDDPSPIEKVKPVENTEVNLIANTSMESLIPEKFEGFVEWGHYSDVKRIVRSRMFYPIFVTGLSGNGKTLMVEQIHASLSKELIRVNITIETDEDDLLGGFRLVNGETKFVPGPVVEAMEKGCTLLLDECDLGSNKIMCLQPVLEGKGVYLKKVNKWILPKKGFNVIATANTKGKGSDDGRFIGTNVLNEAFLERFAITLEQPYPSVQVETKIVLGSMLKYGKTDKEFASKLVDWADVIRKTFFSGAIDEIISTRRLDHIVKTFSIFGNRMKAIQMCVARFDDETRDAFLDLYTKVDSGAIQNETESEESSESTEDNVNDTDEEVSNY